MNNYPIFAPLKQTQMKKNTLYNLVAAASISLLAACSSDNGTVNISGTVANASGEKIALMHLSGNNPVLVDTLTIGNDGSFKFKPQVEKGGPDFFCLVLNNQTITLVSDTLQTPISITTDKDHFGSGYVVSDSLNTELQKAIAMGGDLRRSLINLSSDRQQGKVSSIVFNDSLASMISSYKANVLQKYIYQDPASPISYYLLFETVQGLQIFDPYDAQDSRAFGAVANLWHNIYPNSSRTNYLEQRAREGMALRYQAKKEQERADSLIQNAVVTASNFLDITLLGINDQPVSLSSICGKGSITLVDFTTFFIPEVSVAHNEKISKIYEHYKNQGLKIYQVCLDPDVNFWKVSAANLPWTVVRDSELIFDQEGNLQYSAAAALYNVNTIPTTFIMGRDGSPIVRVEDDNKLESSVAKAL